MVYPVSTNEAITTESLWYNCFIRDEGNSIPKHACLEDKGSNSTTGLVTYSEEILTTSKSHKNKRYKSFPKYYSEVNKLRRIIKSYIKLLNSTKTPSYNFIQISVTWQHDVWVHQRYFSFPNPLPDIKQNRLLFQGENFSCVFNILLFKNKPIQ